VTRKDFQLIADVVRQLRTFPAHDVEMSEDVAHAVRWTTVADKLASALATTNAKFDRERFLEACGIGASDPLTAALAAIEREDQVCFDVCAEHGQMFGNVKGTRWLAEAVAEALESDAHV
jgi:hypothetical protein